jgi:SAM-dependent methyltransferase
MTATQHVPQPSSTGDAEVAKLKDHYRSRFGDGLVLDIDPSDEMYRFLYLNSGKNSAAVALKTYLEMGEGLLRDLEFVWNDLGDSLDRVGSFLDFACGAGRFTRFLAHRLGRGRVAASDISREGVDFVRRGLGVKGFYSAAHPADVDHAGKYDGIYVVSLFSHLPINLFGPWLEKLYSMLNPNGLLLFSTIGPRGFEIMQQQGYIPGDVRTEAEGFRYSPSNETAGRLSGDIYGTSYVSDEFVRGELASRSLGKLLKVYPIKIGNLQDGYAVRKP